MTWQGQPRVGLSADDLHRLDRFERRAVLTQVEIGELRALARRAEPAHRARAERALAKASRART